MNLSAINIKKYTEGFTLVEFIVIMAIFAVMVGVVLFNFTGFRSKITLDNLAQDIAISIRQIQTSAGASISTTDSPEDEIPRGIFFRKQICMPLADFPRRGLLHFRFPC